jgi:hypothetical protein
LEDIFKNKVPGPVSTTVVPELQPYLVSGRKEVAQQMQRRGFVMEHESGVWILLNRSLYRRRLREKRCGKSER